MAIDEIFAATERQLRPVGTGVCIGGPQHILTALIEFLTPGLCEQFSGTTLAEPLSPTTGIEQIEMLCLEQLVDFGITKQQIIDNVIAQKYVEGADYFTMDQLQKVV